MAKKTVAKKYQNKKPTRQIKSETMSSEITEKSENLTQKINKNRNLWVLIIFVALLGVFLYFAKSLFVVAVVNGRPISRLSLINQLEKTGGKTALDSLINKSLIEQAANKENINVSDEDIQSEMEQVKKDLEAQGMSLDAALSAQGMTMVDFEENLRIKQTVEELLRDKVTVSDEDVKKYYDENKELFGEDAKYEELQGSIRQQLESEKLNAEFETWYNKLKQESNIQYFVNY